MMLDKLTFADGRGLWFTGDTHFGHGGQARRRGYQDVAEHDRDMIRNWNEIVGKHDTVFHLGDFAHRATAEHQRAVFNKLHGRKFLIIGNHDDKHTCALPWARPPEHRMLIQIGAQEIVLDHYAGRSWYKSHHGTLQFFGHSHGMMPATRQSCDVGLDAWALAPVTYDEITSYLAIQPPLFDPSEEDEEVPVP